MAAVTKRDSMEATCDGLETKLKDIELGQSTPKTRALNLTELPPSVRKNIYKHVLDTELVNVGKDNVSYTHSIKDGILQFKASRPPFPVETSLFYVSKQISQEAIKYFYSKNIFIRFEIYTSDARHAKTMLEDSGLLFSVAAPEKLDLSSQHAMDLTLVEKNSSQRRAAIMFPAQYLPRLINFLDQASHTTSTWAPTHSLFATVLNTYNFPVSRVQGDLLEVFRLLTDLGAVTIDPKNLLPGYAGGLQASMMASSFTAESWLKTVTDMADRADEAFESKNYDLAHQHMQSGIITMTYGFLTRAEVLHSQTEEYSKAIQRLRWRCELGLGKAISSLHQAVTSSSGWLSDPAIPSEKRVAVAQDLLLAETATSQALSLATDSPSPASNPWFQSLPAELIPTNKSTWFTDEERGMTWYSCGVVHIALIECLFAAGDLERASRLCPNRKEIEDAFEKARDGIDWSTKPGTGLRRAARVARGQ